MKRDFLNLTDLNHKEIAGVLELADQLKKNPIQPLLDGKSLGLVFTKSSTRTRVSFEVGISQLGGSSFFLDVHGLQMTRGESLVDTARVLSRYLDGIVIRTYRHQDVVEFAKHASIPVINGLTDDFHPCQILSDLFTIHEKFKRLEGLKLVYVGDGSNNMAVTWLFGAAMMGMRLKVAAPQGYWPEPKFIREAMKVSTIGQGFFEVTADVKSAVRDADVIYTDVWVSMGQEKEREKRLSDLARYQVNDELLSAANPSAWVMHCLPAHRGEEITDQVVECPKSIIFDQAENRLHVQKALMVILMGDGFALKKK